MDNENGSATAVVPSNIDNLNSTNDLKSDKVAAVETTKTEDLKKMNNLLKDLEGEADDGLALGTIVKQANDTNKVCPTVTTTSITVNIKQTKIGGNESTTSSGDLATTVTEAAAAAITVAADKLETDKKSIKNKSNRVSSDVEMEDLTKDIEMEDLTTKAISSTDDNTSVKKSDAIKLKTIADTSVTTTTSVSSEAEQKIDEVEKNISNLFNGDESAVSSVEHSEPESSRNGDGVKSVDKQLDSVSASVANISKDGLGNGTAATSKTAQTNDTKLKDTNDDNNDLVSILTDDKPIEKGIISSSSSTGNANVSKDSRTPIVATVKSTKINPIENKLLTNIAKSVTSTPSSSSTTQTVYNSTPIQKQFEISSENVSTISEAATDSEHCIGDKSMRQEIISSHSSTTNKSSDISSGAVTGSESSSDNLKRFAKVIRKYNGLGDETDDGSSAQSSTVGSNADARSKRETSGAVTATPSESVSSSSEDNIYDINIWYDDTELTYFGVERQDQHKLNNATSANIDIGTEKVASVSNTSSLTAISSTNTSLSPPPSTKTLNKTKHIVRGTLALCKFMIEHFQNIRTSLSGSSDKNELVRSTETTPVSGQTGRGRVKATTVSTPTSTTSANKRKRVSTVQSQQTPTVAANSTNDDEDEPKSAKKPKKDPVRKSIQPVISEYPEKAVLARWVDKKFYAGRVIEAKPNNKYVVLFEDGAKKVLPEEHIVFGNENILPLENESVHALVKDDTYEPGLVQSVKIKGDIAHYTVLCESTTVTVTASDIYLEDDQAKVILSKQTTSSVHQPEAGYSGGINTRKDRRQKRF